MAARHRPATVLMISLGALSNHKESDEATDDGRRKARLASVADPENVPVQLARPIFGSSIPPLLICLGAFRRPLSVAVEISL